MKRDCAVCLLSAGKFMPAAVSILVLIAAPLSRAPAAPPPAEGIITIITVPERAEVWIDNNYAGLSPVRHKRLAAGTYTLRLVDPSQQISATEVVAVQQGGHLLVE